MSAAPRTARGRRPAGGCWRRPRRCSPRSGYHEASIVKITEAAGVGQGTFYLYFDSKQAIFDELVDDLNRRVRHAMTEAARAAGTRLEAERARLPRRSSASPPSTPRSTGSSAQAEFVSPERAAAALHAASSRATSRG